MDDVLELPDADVSRLQDRGQSEEADDGDSSGDEEEGGLDWTKLPCVFHPFIRPMPSKLCAGSGLPSLDRSSPSVETKSMSPRQGRTFRNTTSEGLALRCSTP